MYSKGEKFFFLPCKIMLTRMPIDIIREIMYYLPNESIFKLESSFHKYSDLRKEKVLVSTLINREHPIVFNICDNFCRKCNWLPYLQIKNKNKYLGCYHY